MRSLVLASRSAARSRLLSEAGVDFVVQVGEADERLLKHAALARGATPREIAVELALAKARSVASMAPQSVVIGADQTLELDGELFDKPPTLAVAREQLVALRKRPHQLHAAIACVQQDHVAWSYVASATLHARDFSERFLDDYLAKEGDVLLDCVGAYRLEGLGAQLFAHIEGDYFTILGLPLLPLLAHLRERGVLAP